MTDVADLTRADREQLSLHDSKCTRESYKHTDPGNHIFINDAAIQKSLKSITIREARSIGEVGQSR